MANIKEPFNKFTIKLQESVLTLGYNKRIRSMRQYIDIGPSDVLLDVGGNTGKITEVYARDCKEIVVLEPKHAIVEYGRKYRPHIKFVEGGVENIPFAEEYFDKVVASASFHHFPNQDRGLDEMKRVLKPNGSFRPQPLIIDYNLLHSWILLPVLSMFQLQLLFRFLFSLF